MSGAALSFFASAGVAGLAGLVAVSATQPRHALAGFALVLAALVVPLVQLRAPVVAGVSLFASAVAIALLGGLAGVSVRAAASAARRTRVYWVLAGLGLAGFVWVLLATGSRQVVELPPTLSEGASFGDGTLLVQVIAAEQGVASLLVGALALAAVVAAVLTLVVEPGADTSAPAHDQASTAASEVS